jgi:uncharacterized protein YbbC (DUF1343 family)
LSKFEKKLCQGCYILVTDRTKIEPARTGLTIAHHLKQLFGDAFQLDSIVRLLQNDAALAAVNAGADPAKLPELWQSDLEHFRAVRQRYLIYR